MAIKVLELDVSQQLSPISLADEYEGCRILVRVHRQPVGWIVLQRPANNTYSVAALNQAIQKQVSMQVIQKAFANLFGIGNSRTSQDIFISVIVCTRNRTQSLADCITSLLNQQYQNFEIIIVDNASDNDDTFELVRNLNVRYVRENLPGLDWARNRGIQESQYEIVAFTDDDVQVDRFWLAAIAKEFQKSDVMGVTGFVAPAKLDTTAQILFELSYGGMGHGFDRRVIKSAHMTDKELMWASNFGIGANMAFRKSIFSIIGYFDVALDVGTPSNGGGDIEMFHRLVVNRGTLVYEPGILVWHNHRESAAALNKQIFNNGRSFGCYLITCYKKSTVRKKSVLEFLMVNWLYHWNFKNLLHSRIPRRLAIVEFYGMLTSPGAYKKSQEHAKKTAAMPM